MVVVEPDAGMQGLQGGFCLASVQAWAMPRVCQTGAERCKAAPTLTS